MFQLCVCMHHVCADIIYIMHHVYMLSDTPSYQVSIKPIETVPCIGVVIRLGFLVSNVVHYLMLSFSRYLCSSTKTTTKKQVYLLLPPTLKRSIHTHTHTCSCSRSTHLNQLQLKQNIPTLTSCPESMTSTLCQAGSVDSFLFTKYFRCS